MRVQVRDVAELGRHAGLVRAEVVVEDGVVEDLEQLEVGALGQRRRGGGGRKRG